MPTSPGQPSRRRPRRAVRPAGTVGGDEANLRTALPVPPPDDLTWGRPAPGSDLSGAGAPVRRSPDDEDVGWGAPVVDSNDDRLSRDRPPHW